MKKKILGVLLILGVIVFGLVGCSEKVDDGVLRVGATAVPHGELLNLIKDDLKKEGVTLEIIEFNDYVKPNLALGSGEIDANYFQHAPYLEDFKSEHSLKLETLCGIHIEPMGIYSNEIDDLKELKQNSTIAIPNDAVNQGRALLLLQENGLIELDEKAGIMASELDVINNPLELEFKVLEAPQIPRVLDDVTIALINGNYALSAGINPVKDSIALENEESPYVNIVAVREGEREREDLQILKKYLQSDKVVKYIEDNYNGGVVKAFN